jgi:hypothetical protein
MRSKRYVNRSLRLQCVVQASLAAVTCSSRARALHLGNRELVRVMPSSRLASSLPEPPFQRRALAVRLPDPLRRAADHGAAPPRPIAFLPEWHLLQRRTRPRGRRPRRHVPHLHVSQPLARRAATTRWRVCSGGRRSKRSKGTTHQQTRLPIRPSCLSGLDGGCPASRHAQTANHGTTLSNPAGSLATVSFHKVEHL